MPKPLESTGREDAMKLSAVVLRAFCLFLSLCLPLRAADTDKSPKPQSGAAPRPELKVIEKWRGTWDVKSTRHAPGPVEEESYVETYDWILDERFLRSETSQKTDGTKSVSMFWFDVYTKTYRFVIFYSAGYSLELPPPTWNESTQTMEWKGGVLSPIIYTAHATFSDRDTIRWKSSWKDWKGTAILELEGVSTRRR
jgi:hypothetical protein